MKREGARLAEATPTAWFESRACVLLLLLAVPGVRCRRRLASALLQDGGACRRADVLTWKTPSTQSAAAAPPSSWHASWAWDGYAVESRLVRTSVTPGSAPQLADNSPSHCPRLTLIDARFVAASRSSLAAHQQPNARCAWRSPTPAGWACVCEEVPGLPVSARGVAAELQ